SHRTTAPYLAIGTFGQTDVAGEPARIDVSSGGTRIELVDVPLGAQPATVDWLLTFSARTLQHDLVYQVTGAPSGAVWEVAFGIDTDMPRVGDPSDLALDGDVAGFPAWVMGSGRGHSFVTAYRSGSAFGTDNHWFEPNHGQVAWQP